MQSELNSAKLDQATTEAVEAPKDRLALLNEKAYAMANLAQLLETGSELTDDQLRGLDSFYGQNDLQSTEALGRVAQYDAQGNVTGIDHAISLPSTDYPIGPDQAGGFTVYMANQRRSGIDISGWSKVEWRNAMLNFMTEDRAVRAQEAAQQEESRQAEIKAAQEKIRAGYEADQQAKAEQEAQLKQEARQRLEEEQRALDELSQQVAALEAQVQPLKDEVARLEAAYKEQHAAYTKLHHDQGKKGFFAKLVSGDPSKKAHDEWQETKRQYGQKFDQLEPLAKQLKELKTTRDAKQLNVERLRRTIF